MLMLNMLCTFVQMHDSHTTPTFCLPQNPERKQGWLKIIPRRGRTPQTQILQSSADIIGLPNTEN